MSNPEEFLNHTKDIIYDTVTNIDWVGWGNYALQKVEKVGELSRATIAMYGPEVLAEIASKSEFAPNNPFHDTLSDETRKALASKVIKENKGLLPVIVEKARGSKLNNHKARKLLVQPDMTVAMVLSNVRRYINMNSSKSLFLSVSGTGVVLSPPSLRIGDVYSRYRNDDGFLYIVYREEDIFG